MKDAVDEIKKELISATGASQADKEKIVTTIKTHVSNIKSAIANANFGGSNLLNGPADAPATPEAAAANNLEIVSAYNRSGNTVTLDKITVSGTDTNANTMVKELIADTFFTKDTKDADIAGLLTKVETALGSLVKGAATLGSAKAQIDGQKSFLSGLQNSIEKGVGTLVDADMNKESARLSALQVQQQLGVQALSIANSNSQSIMSLFRG